MAQYIEEPIVSGLHYDDCSVRASVRQSMGPGDYFLANEYNEIKPCYYNSPGFFGANTRPIGSLVDIESELFTLNTPLTKCDTGMYKRIKNCKDCNNCDQGVPCNCKHCRSSKHSGKNGDFCANTAESTRLRKPCNLRNSSSTVTTQAFDFDFPFKPLLVQGNGYIGSNTRNFTKDIQKQFTASLFKK